MKIIFREKRRFHFLMASSTKLDGRKYAGGSRPSCFVIDSFHNNNLLGWEVFAKTRKYQLHKTENVSISLKQLFRCHLSTNRGSR